MTCSRRLIVAFAVALLPWIDAEAQLRPPPAPRGEKVVAKIASVATNSNAAALAAMLVGPGVTITNAKFSGDAAAAGTFAGGQASVGLDTGVVLSTGNAVDVQGPNQSDSWSTDFGRPGDAQLDALVAPFATQDATILEFDVTPVANTMSVRFVFASEEYNEFVGSPFNDVIAIFVNGVNCANFGGRPVNVNSINNGINATLYIDNEAGTRNTEMDGMTVPLERLLAAIDETTLLVPFSHVLFKSAFLQDAKAIIDRAHEVGAMVVLKEPIPGGYWAGIALILAGLVVIGRAQSG